MLSRFGYVAQRVPLSCFGTGTAGGWSHWAVLVSGVVGGDPTGLCWFDLPRLRRSESLGADAQLISIESVLYRVFFQSGL